MPIYDYDCAACGRRVEVVHGVHAPGPTHCPNCGSGPLKKAIAAPAVHFKGSGWAKRDRRATVSPGASKGSSEPAAASDGDGKGGGESASASKDAASDAGPKGGSESGVDRGADRGRDRAAAGPKATGAGTATKTD